MLCRARRSQYLGFVGSTIADEGEEEEEYDTSGLPVHAQLLHNLLQVRCHL